MAGRKHRPLIAGNWKMNGLLASGAELQAIIANSEPLAAKADLLICPPTTLVASFATRARGSVVAIGGQDCHTAPSGAHTGDVSAEMLKDAGAWFVIVGHSERRADHGETDSVVNAKAEAAWRAGLTAILCVGETRAERDAGKALEVVGRQLAASVPDAATVENLVIAYEPVWAIGSGLTPTLDDVAEVHGLIRKELGQLLGEGEGSRVRILYGGSVKPANAGELLFVPEVNGALVGGASLKCKDLYAILSVYGGRSAC
jgi:triosephosphate isomerase (TIM)